MTAPAMYDPYNYISYVELNKRKRGDYERDRSERIENRTTRPPVKKIYVKRNGDTNDVKPKLYIWRQWQSPSLPQLLDELGPFVGEEEAVGLFEASGRRVTDEDDIVDNGLYYVTGDETFYRPHEYDHPRDRRQNHSEGGGTYRDGMKRKEQYSTQYEREWRGDSMEREEDADNERRGKKKTEKKKNGGGKHKYFDVEQKPGILSKKGNGKAKKKPRKSSLTPRARSVSRPPSYSYNHSAPRPESDYHYSAHNTHKHRTLPSAYSTSGHYHDERYFPNDYWSDVEEEDGGYESEPMLTYSSPNTRNGGISRAMSKATNYISNKASNYMNRVTDYKRRKSKELVGVFKVRKNEEAPFTPYTTLEDGDQSIRPTVYTPQPVENPQLPRGTTAYDNYNDDRSRRKKNNYSAPEHNYRSESHDYQREREHGETRGRDREREREREWDSREKEKERDRDRGEVGPSDFDDEMALLRDRKALEKHKQKHSTYTRSQSAQIFNRRDQTHPDAYIIYAFLNGNGMDCQYNSFQKRQLEKGMSYVLELVARRFRVNPAKLCNMDGKKMGDVSDLMSRGAYVLVPVGQSFRETWYFLPDNAIDTSSDAVKVRERSAQRDRLIQRREKSETAKRKKSVAQTRSKSQDYYRR